LNIVIQNGVVMGSLCVSVCGMKGQSVIRILVFDIWVYFLVLWSCQHVSQWHISSMCFLRVKDQRSEILDPGIELISMKFSHLTNPH